MYAEANGQETNTANSLQTSGIRPRFSYSAPTLRGNTFSGTPAALNP